VLGEIGGRQAFRQQPVDVGAADTDLGAERNRRKA